MEDNLEFLKEQWKATRLETQSNLDFEGIMATIKRKQKSVLLSHYGNTLVLVLTLIMISLFFYYLTPFQDLLSHVGVALMIGGLSVRIIIEIFSSLKSSRIKYSDNVRKSAASTLAFYNFRKQIHGPVTYAIVGLYTLGFYMLTPEFSLYIELKWIILMDVGYVIGAAILIKIIRKGIREEMNHLSEILEINRELS